MKKAIAALLVGCVLAGPAAAQESVWVQIEAQPTLNAAQGRAQAYDAALDDVNGFFLGGGWYGIVLGPYSTAEAGSVLRQLRSSGAIPRDSFIARGNNFRQQFWPVGGSQQATTWSTTARLAMTPSR